MKATRLTYKMNAVVSCALLEEGCALDLEVSPRIKA
jgi:hypothetical protein